MAGEFDVIAGAEAPVGRRERNKRVKEQAIREAARALFIEKGYEATTLREIADMADVGFGTVFAYANDKAGLLAMVFVEELKALPPLFEGGQGDLLDELVAGLAHLYRFWANVPSLSGHVLQQMEFFSSNPHLNLILARRAQARTELATWLGRAQEARRVAADIDVQTAADTLFAIYTSAVREWSGAAPHDVEAGLARLRALMILPVRGLTAG